ncbi:MAG: bleomycin resistance protein [Marmoricola sp.]|jgi:catechol 2,3-dioxygenase-like lactoylglutathione lyase family enzyme|nr:bleomycin resistance protein [Marmoricola sp.]
MKLFHINVVCTDFEKSYAFYTEKLGMVPLTRRTAAGGGAPAGALTKLPDGRLPGEARTKDADQEGSRRALGMTGDMGSRGVLLYWAGMPEGPYIDLLEWNEGGYAVERTPKGSGFARLALQVDDIEAEYARMQAAGVEFVSSPTLITLGATAIKIVFFEDPDGTLLEFVELSAGGWGTV